MHKICLCALMLVPTLLATGLVPRASTDNTVIHFSFYAPLQKDSPVHIVGFEHDEREIQFVLSNTSDKSIASVIISDVMIPPPGCAVELRKGRLSSSGGRFQVLIAPHGQAVASGSRVHYPKMLVDSAQDLGAAYMQAQFGIEDVFFEDGTTWPSPIDLHDRAEPFDPSLVEAEAGKCPDVAAVANALRSVTEVVFEHEAPATSSKSDDESTPPRLRFSCRLEGPKAVCRLPLETVKARDESN